MKFSYRLKKVCGSVYSNGNLSFTPDGNSVISPVGNRLTIFDLVQQNSFTLPFENRKNIKIVAVSNNGRFLITVDVEGHALFINLPRQVVLHRFNFKQKVHDIKFSPNDELFAVTFGHGCQVWKSPSIQRSFSPLTLSRTIAGHHDDTTCLDWSADSESIIMGSKDLSARIYYRVSSKYMSTSVLSGHRDTIVGAFYAKDNDAAYTVARDGAVFTWKFEHSDREAVAGAAARNSEEDTEEEDVSDGEEGALVPVKRQSAKQRHALQQTKRTSHWYLAEREFLWDPHTHVSAVDFNKSSSLLVVGFDQGVFGLYEMPGCVNIHRLSVSSHSLNSVSINNNGEWLAVGSSRLGQLLVWEWQSESYVLKQQGHLYGLNALDFSGDGQFIATGGEDSKVKIWNATSGFCFITFSEHIAPVTGVKFVGKGNGKALLSCSLDGTVRAHDLLRYKNFRTMTTPTPVQFTCLAVDPSGEVVCAGAMDPFNIYVWSLQTGRLLDILAGHEGPIACLDFSSGATTILASGSWDGTLKLWDVFANSCVETFEHGCDVLAVAFRPDGKEVCCAATNGNLYFWDVEEGTQISIIEGRRDISGGRLTTDAMTADNAARSKYFTSVSYTADGSCVLAGGRSKYTCIYAVGTGVLIKKFQLSHNRSLEGIVDELRSDRLVDGVAIDSIAVGDSDDEYNAYNALPGGGKSKLNDGSRTTRPEVVTSALRFSPTGRDWAVSTTQGLQIFSLDDAMLFAPTDLDVAITPQSVAQAVNREEFALAVNMALHLGERAVLKKAVDAVAMDSVELVVKSLDARMLRDFLKFLAEEVAGSRHVEYYLQWCWAVICAHGPVLQSALTAMPLMESLRALIRAVSAHEKEVMRMSDENAFTLAFLTSQLEAATATTDATTDGEDGEHMDVVSTDNAVDVVEEEFPVAAVETADTSVEHAETRSHVVSSSPTAVKPEETTTTNSDTAVKSKKRKAAPATPHEEGGAAATSEISPEAAAVTVPAVPDATVSSPKSPASREVSVITEESTGGGNSRSSSEKKKKKRKSIEPSEAAVEVEAEMPAAEPVVLATVAEEEQEEVAATPTKSSRVSSSGGSSSSEKKKKRKSVASSESGAESTPPPKTPSPRPPNDVFRSILSSPPPSSVAKPRTGAKKRISFGKNMVRIISPNKK